MSVRYLRTSFYVQFQAEEFRHGGVRSIKAVALTQNRPAHPKAGAVMVKLAVELPEDAFMPLVPETGTIRVLPDFLERQPVHADVDTDIDGGDES